MSNRDNEDFDNAQRALFREVSEDVEKEQFLLFWKKHGKKAVIIIASALIVIFSTLAYVLYTDWRIEKNAVVYAKALNESLYNPKEASEIFNNLIEQDSDGFALLSRIQSAAIMLDQGQDEQGLQDLKTIGTDSSVPSPFRNLALTILSYHLLDKDGKEQELTEIITPLAQEKSLWRGSAREILALVALKQNDKEKAIELLNQNKNDPNLPDSFKIRAKEMLSVLK